ncbi:MAG: N-acetyltransferase [Gammaproteobacteria bacterium]|jgi:putative acetyltransferase|nr:N-acetyltransferase [Gammaproteobacteria bacterium]MBT7370861.1 N-acetyltransferase [Gammaproteobacteria bacterium]
MNAGLKLRLETETDWSEIRDLTELAFRDRPYSGGDEQDVVDRLRSDGALTLSLVAIDAGKLVGQITFSPAEVADGSGPWFALGPVSVLPEKQSEGIGSKLILEGLERIRGMGALGCILTGNPDYYRRFGFEISPPNTPVEEEEEFFMLKLLHGNQPEGRFLFHKAFYGDV